jgi:biotin synthase
MRYPRRPISLRRPLDRAELTQALGARGADQQALFARARAARAQAVGDQVILRGVVEVTNVCRVNCEYCPMRRDNLRTLHRYTLDVRGLVGAAEAIRDAGIDVVFIQGGEIPQTTKLVGEALPKIRTLFGDRVEVLLSLGIKSRAELSHLRDRGATSYILKHETSDPELSRRLRHQTLASRIRCLEDLLDLGYRVGTGTIVGLPGQTAGSIVDDILLGRELGVHMCSASPFVPAPDTPLRDCAPGSVDTTLNAIAAMRLTNPDWLIPAVSALEKGEQDGQARGLAAGANVITTNFTPPRAMDSYLIYGKDRFVVTLEHMTRTLATAGLERGGSGFV